MSRLIFTLLCFSLLGHESYSLNRINSPTDPAKRCVKTVISQNTCQSMREKALKLNCITQEEYQVLKKYGAYPSCNFLKGEGLDMLDGWCPCGCFTPGTLIAMSQGDNPIGSYKRAFDLIFNSQTGLVSHLEKNSNLDHFLYKASKIRLKIYGKELKKVYEIRTEDMRKIILTERHPVLISKGLMKQARHVSLSDKLVLMSGKPIGVKEIKRIPFKKDVLNFSLDVDSYKEHLIFANGLVIGDQYWQSALEDLLNQVIIRNS